MNKGGRTELAPALERKNGSHETTSGLRSGELGRDDSTQRVITTDTKAHEKPPADEGTDDTNSWALTADCLTERADDDNDKLDAICEMVIRRRAQKSDVPRASDLHMRLRPTMSASQPKRSCPQKVPTGVATLTPRSWLVFKARPLP